MNYGDSHSLNSAAVLPIASADLPQEFLDTLPLKFDSLRLRLATQRVDVVDAWGEMKIPNAGISQIFEVLREKRVEIRELRLDIKISILPWQDITDLFGESLSFLGKDTITSYHFFSNDVKEPIAVVTMNNDESAPSNVVFKADDITSNVRNIGIDKANLFVYPNPAFADVRFEFINMESGQYRLKVFNILGVQVWEKAYHLGGAKTVREDFSKLKKGTYLYCIPFYAVCGIYRCGLI
jgi:hypothetical protein